MLRVTVELLPGGSEERKTVLGTATISLVEIGGPGTIGAYHALFSGKGGRVLRDVRVGGFPRKRLLAWDLLLRCLKEGFGERNKEAGHGQGN